MKPPLMTRLTAPVAVLSALLLVIALGAAWYVRDMQKSMAHLVANNVASVNAAQELEISIREARNQLDRYLITGDDAHLAPLPRLRRRAADALREAETTASTPPEQVLMARARAGYEHFFGEYEHLLRVPPARGAGPGIDERTGAGLAREILEPAHEYLRLNEGMLTQASETNQAVAERLTAGLVAVGLSGSAGGLLAGWALAVAVRRSIQRTQDRLRSTADELGRVVPDGGPAADPLQRVTESVPAVLARLRQSERDALRAEQLARVGQMAAGIAHEVRNPLMAIKLLVQAAADPRRGGPFRPRDLRVLEEEIVRLEQIVTGFLDFARPPRPDKRPVDVGRLVEQAADGVRARAELQGVAVAVESPPTPVVLQADANQLRQVLLNLLFNALDAQPGGGRVRVAVGAEVAHPGADPALVVRVEDDGPGLPAGLGERAFEPFVSTKEAGLGLGLSISRRIVEGHGGTVRADGWPGGGAAFTVRLPLAGTPAGADQLAGATA